MAGRRLKYRYLKHTADLEFVSYGRNLDECFENAGEAVFNVITDIESVGSRTVKQITLNSGTIEDLMHDWLSELIFLFSAEGMLFREFKVKIKKEQDGGYALSATLYGEKFNPERHAIEKEVKAATYHELSVKKGKDKWIAQVVCDT